MLTKALLAFIFASVCFVQAIPIPGVRKPLGVGDLRFVTSDGGGVVLALAQDTKTIAKSDESSGAEVGGGNGQFGGGKRG